jgi:hypothetical protein
MWHDLCLINETTAELGQAKRHLKAANGFSHVGVVPKYTAGVAKSPHPFSFQNVRTKPGQSSAPRILPQLATM